MKLKIREQDICSGVNKYLKLTGICYRRIHNLGFATMKGTPDYWITIKGMSIAVEIKKPNTHLKPDQKEYLTYHATVGEGISAVIRSVDEFMKFIKDVKNGYYKLGEIFSSQYNKDFGGEHDNKKS